MEQTASECFYVGDQLVVFTHYQDYELELADQQRRCGTFCEISDQHGSYATGCAVLCPGDVYNPQVGRRLALARAIDGFDTQTVARFARAYHRHFPAG